MKRMRLATNNIQDNHVSPAIVTLPSFRKTLLLSFAFFTAIIVNAQEKTTAEKEAEYRKVVTERSAKIVNTLGIKDSSKYYKVLNEVASQYIQINTIHDQNKAAIVSAKAQSSTKEETEAAIKKLETEKSSRLLQRHGEFIAHLKESLTDEQLELVKDGMTYRVFPITYASYQDMLPNLTEEQKQKIYSLLKEARELAMDEGSSEDKHKVFGKYKGKANIYLSSQGYDLKKETAAWQQRLKEKRTGNN